MAKSCAYLANNWDKGQDKLWLFLTTFSTIHGCNHHFTIKLHAAIKLFVLYQPSFKKGFTALWGCHLGIIKLVHYFHLKMQRWYSRQWSSVTSDRVATPTFVKNLNNWIDSSIVANWIPDTKTVPALRPLHQSWNDYNNCINSSPPVRAPPPPPNPAQSVTPPTRQNMNNRN